MVVQDSQLDPASGVLRVRLTVAGAWLLHLLASSPGQVLTFTLHQASTSPDIHQHCIVTSHDEYTKIALCGWTGWLQEGAPGQVAGFWPPVGEEEGVQEAGTITATGVDITAL